MIRTRFFLLMTGSIFFMGTGWFFFHWYPTPKAFEKSFPVQFKTNEVGFPDRSNTGYTESDDELLQQATDAVVSSPDLALAIAQKLLEDDPADRNGRVAA